MAGEPNVIYADGQPYYRLTSEDKLWLARMMAGEGADPRDRKAQLWTIAQRFVARGRRYEQTITDLVLNFSQPVNEDWSRTGVFCRPGGQYAGTENCSPARLDRRDDYATMSPAQLRPELALVEAWAKGRIPNPVPRAVDWHATLLKPGYTRIGNYPNVFQASPQSMAWPADKVRVGGAGPGIPVWGGILIGAGVLGAAGAVLAAQRAR